MNIQLQYFELNVFNSTPAFKLEEAIMHSHIIGYTLLACCFVVAYFIGEEINPKVKTKTTPDSDVSDK